MMLYQFEKLARRMDEWGFPELESGSGFRSIRTDFKQAFDAGKIEFRDDGIYLLHDGQEWKGYMYMPTYRVQWYSQVSRFHLKRCSVIDDFISGGMFRTYYQWSNNKTNDIEDRDTNETHSEQTLQLCSRCREEIFDNIEDTEDFFDTLETEEVEETSKEVDIFGYDREWQRISRAYRKKMNYTCEECGIEIPDRTGYRYLHTHHISGDKTNNRESNLECLCVLCHAYKDIRHEENFDRKRMKNEIRAFINKYRDKLGGNAFLTRFDRENPT